MTTVLLIVTLAVHAYIACQREDLEDDRPDLWLTVRAPEGFQSTRLYAWAKAFDGDTPPDVTRVTEGSMVAVGAAGEGPLEFFRLGRGSFRIALSYVPMSQAATTIDVRIDDRGTTAYVDLPPPPEEGTVRARAIGPDGEVLRDVRWSITRVQGVHSATATGSEVHRDDGTALFLAAASRPATFDRCTVVAHHETLGSASAEADGSSIIEVRFGEPVDVHGVIDGYAGSDLVDMIRVHVTPEGEWGRGHRAWGHGEPVEGDGRFSLPPLQPGRYVISLYKRGGNPSPTRIAAQTVTVKPDMPELRFAKPE